MDFGFKLEISDLVLFELHHEFKLSLFGIELAPCVELLQTQRTELILQLFALGLAGGLF